MAAALPVRHALDESGCLGLQPQMGGKFHLKLNIGTRPIANKYREGKMKSTLKRELKARETVEREAIEVSNGRIRISRGRLPQRSSAQAGVGVSRCTCFTFLSASVLAAG